MFYMFHMERIFNSCNQKAVIWSCVCCGASETIFMFVTDRSLYSFVDAIALCNDVLLLYVRFEVFTAVTMKNAVFWDVSRRVAKDDVLPLTLLSFPFIL
jgi:hypothetical protein